VIACHSVSKRGVRHRHPPTFFASLQILRLLSPYTAVLASRINRYTYLLSPLPAGLAVSRRQSPSVSPNPDRTFAVDEAWTEGPDRASKALPGFASAQSCPAVATMWP